MRRSESIVVVVCTIVGAFMVVLADLARSYVPLFFIWVAVGAIPFALGAMERRRAKQMS